MKQHEIVFLFDVDNTLLDNDRVTKDLRDFLDREVGAKRSACYWEIFETLRTELGYADYLGALQRYRLDYPFAKRLYPLSPDVLAHCKQFGKVVILTDGDVVFQPRKIESSGLFNAVDGNILIYIHKERELADVARRYPARKYVLVDDKVRILSAVKAVWGRRVTTIFPRQGHYAFDEKEVSKYPPPDIQIEGIGKLLEIDKF